MKPAILIISFSVLCVSVMAQPKPKTKTTAKPVAKAAPGLLKSKLDSLSYSFGQSVANQLKNVDVKDLNYALFRKGVEDGIKGLKPALDEQQVNACLNEHFMGQQMKMASAEKAAGNKFLEENKKRKGIIVLPNGLQYEILKEGSGAIPKATDTIVAHYAGSLIDGKEFDNSYKRGEPIRFAANNLIKGWTEALIRMPVGSKWKLYIPSDLGYGDYGAGQDIPGGAALIFELELLDIIPAKNNN